MQEEKKKKPQPGMTWLTRSSELNAQKHAPLHVPLAARHADTQTLRDQIKGRCRVP